MDSGAATTQCKGNCGFWGSSAMEGYCSQCYKIKNGPAVSAVAAAKLGAPAKPDMSSFASPSLPPLHGSTPTAMTMLPSSGGKDVQTNRSRCWQCKKKVGLLGFNCPCDYTFCSKCRYPEEHKCPHDFMKGISLFHLTKLFHFQLHSYSPFPLFSDGRSKLAKENQKVEAAKFDRIE
jgi:hypothetical protein